jgi:hypothetical protein
VKGKTQTVYVPKDLMEEVAAFIQEHEFWTFSMAFLLKLAGCFGGA